MKRPAPVVKMSAVEGILNIQTFLTNRSESPVKQEVNICFRGTEKDNECIEKGNIYRPKNFTFNDGIFKNREL
jgi:hypothetical protein